MPISRIGGCKGSGFIWFHQRGNYLFLLFTTLFRHLCFFLEMHAGFYQENDQTDVSQ